MGLVKHGKVYWLDLRIKGKRIRRSLRTSNKFLALDRYKEKKDELLSEYGQGKIRFSDFCEQYLKWAWSSKPASAQREEQRLEKIKEFFSGLKIMFLEDITSYHIEQFKAELKTWKVTKDRTLSNTTINRYLQQIKRMFNKAIEWGVYDKANPVRGIRFFKEKRRSRTLSDGQVQKIIHEALLISNKSRSTVQEFFHDLVILAINTGLRRSETLNLKWKHVYEDEIDVVGKGDKLRSVPLNSSARSIIDRQPQRNEYVFDIPNRDQPSLFRRTIETIRKRTGVKFIFHDFRHYFATKLVEKGADFITIAEILGHSKTTVSLGYTHTSRERKKKAVDSMDILPDTEQTVIRLTGREFKFRMNYRIRNHDRKGFEKIADTSTRVLHKCYEKHTSITRLYKWQKKKSKKPDRGSDAGTSDPLVPACDTPPTSTR